MEAELGKIYPGFSILLSCLKVKLSEDGASQSVQKSFDQAKRDLSKARSHYLTNKIVHSELGEILTDLEVLSQDHGLNSEEEKVKDLLRTNLTYAELHDYLHFCPNATSSSTLFGIIEDDLNRHNPAKMNLSGLIPRVEERLMQKCEDLYSYFDPSNSVVPLSDVPVTNKALCLPDLVHERKSSLSREKAHLQHTRQQRDKQFWSYFQKLLECLSVMEVLIQTVKCGSQAETDRVTVEYLAVLCKLTCLKVKSSTLQVLCDTYTVDSVKALKAVSGHLDTATSQAKRQLSATSQSLHAFRRLGPEFTALAQQMAQLQKELENKKWGLEQFGEKLSTSSSRHDTTRSVTAASASTRTDVDQTDRQLAESNTSSSVAFSVRTDKTLSELDSLDSTKSRNNEDFPQEVAPAGGASSEDIPHSAGCNSNSNSVWSYTKSQLGKKVSFQ